jgi:hypothetical protein
MSGTTATGLVERANILDTKVGSIKKHYPTIVAETRFKAMMKGRRSRQRLVELASDGNRLGDSCRHLGGGLRRVAEFGTAKK